MKIFPLLIVAVACSITSCQSEYEERMEKAIVLKNQYELLDRNASSTTAAELADRKVSIREQIEFHAKLSGNERLFLNSVWKEKY